MKRNHILPFLVTGFLLASCGGKTNSVSNNANSNTPSNSTSSAETVVINGDTNYDTDVSANIADDGTSNAYDEGQTKFVDENIAIPTTYDEFSGNVISAEGKYLLSGEYSSFSITAAKDSEIFIFFDGVTISSNTGVAFGSTNKIDLHIVLLNNSVNSITNDYIDTNAFHVKGDVAISGNGTLNLESKQKNALKASKDLFVSENVTINAIGANHAITARSITTKGATINVTSNGKDGMQLECDSDVTSFNAKQGFAFMVDTTFTANTKGDGIQADTYVYLSGGAYNITTQGQFISYSTTNMSAYGLSTDDFKYVKSGDSYKRVAKDEIRSLNSSYYALANSVKGIKAGPIAYDSNGDDEDDTKVTTGNYDIYIAHEANVTINSIDDCMHTSYGNLTIENSVLNLATLDDGLHADYSVNINNAGILVTSSYEGIEGAEITIDGENTALVLNSSDDGINAASDLSKTNNIYIKNGYLRVYASGDGLDANTGLYLQGGIVIVEGPGSMNGSLDASKVYFQGGIVFACSTSGMMEQMTATQNTFIYQGNTIAANSKISVVDANNDAIFSYTLKQSCNQIIFSSAALQIGQTYKIVNGTTSLANITMSSTLTKVGTSQGGPGGGGPGGGGPGGPRP